MVTILYVPLELIGPYLKNIQNQYGEELMQWRNQLVFSFVLLGPSLDNIHVKYMYIHVHVHVLTHTQIHVHNYNKYVINISDVTNSKSKYT